MGSPFPESAAIGDADVRGCGVVAMRRVEAIAGPGRPHGPLIAEGIHTSGVTVRAAKDDREGSSWN
jgi:hypothetical protein